MKKLMLIVLLLVGVVAANAQDTKKTTAKLPKALLAKLNLTAEQQTKVNAIMLNKTASLDSLKAVTTGDKLAKKKKKSINAEAQVKLDAVLTPDQKKIYADFEEAKKAKNQVKKAQAGDMTAPPAKQ